MPSCRGFVRSLCVVAVLSALGYAAPASASAAAADKPRLEGHTRWTPAQLEHRCRAAAATRRARMLRRRGVRGARRLRRVERRCRVYRQLKRRRRQHQRPAPPPVQAPPGPEAPAPQTPPSSEPAPPGQGAPAPAPDPPPAGDSSACPGFAAFGAGLGAPACWRPYGTESPWNRTVPRNAPSAPRSAEVVRRMLSWGAAQNMLAGHADTGADYYHPIYFSKASDPVFELDATQPWGTAEIEGDRIHVPDAARPAAGGDGHLSVITEDGWEYDLWTVSSKPAGGGRLRFGWGGRTRVDGDGLGSNATAAHFGLAAGVIRAPELEAGRIDHALFMGVRCTAPASQAVYPAAAHTGEPCSKRRESDADAPPMGSRFVLDMSDAQIDALRVPGWKKTILRALASYGMIVGDAIGSGAWGLQLESGSSYTSFGGADPLAAFARRAGLGQWNGMYVFNLQDGVDWSRLRMVEPCVSARNC